MNNYNGTLFLFLFGCIFALGIWQGFWGYMDRHVGYAERFPQRVDDHEKIRVLAVGESTTAKIAESVPWPEYLEVELNDRAGGDRFRVYNLGVSGTVSSRIFESIPRLVERYDPHIVVTMMGINDVNLAPYTNLESNKNQDFTSFFTNNRFYRYVHYFVRLLTGKNQINLIQSASACGRDAMGESGWRRITDSPIGTQEKRTLTFIEEFPFSYHGYESIIDLYIRASRFDDANTWIEKANALEPYIRLCGMALTKKSRVDVIDITTNIDNAFTYIDSAARLVHEAQIKGETFDLATYQNPSDSPILDTNTYYPKVSSYLEKQGVIHVAMQYPMLPVVDLEKTVPQKPHVFFVSNEKNFQQALLTTSYNALFVDHFAGIFGHTTDYGAKLIATAAAEVIMRTPLVVDLGIGATQN